MHHTDHPPNYKRGGACIIYKAAPHLRVLNISNLNECINFEVSIAKKFTASFICIAPLPKRKTYFKYSDQI